MKSMETARGPKHTIGRSVSETRLPAAAPGEIVVPPESGNEGASLICSTCEVSWVETRASGDNGGAEECWSCGQPGDSWGKLSSIVSPYRWG